MATRKALTSEQEAVVKGILNEQAKCKRLDKSHKTATTQLNARVARALQQGIPAATLAERLECTVQRVYQMRDNTR